MWPDWASRQLEISPCTLMSVKFLARRSRMRAVSSLTVQTGRVGMRLKVSCWVIVRDSRFLANNLWRAPRGSSKAWQRKELKSNDFESVARKGVIGTFFGSLARKRLSDL